MIERDADEKVSLMLCLHCHLKPCHAGPARFDKVSWHRTSSAQHLLTCQCKQYQAKSVLQPCRAKYLTSVFQSPKRVTAISRLCSCIPCVFVPSCAFLLLTEEETINPIAIMNNYHVMRYRTSHPFKSKIDRTWTALIIAV